MHNLVFPPKTSKRLTTNSARTAKKLTMAFKTRFTVRNNFTNKLDQIIKRLHNFSSIASQAFSWNFLHYWDKKYIEFALTDLHYIECKGVDRELANEYKNTSFSRKMLVWLRKYGAEMVSALSRNLKEEIFSC